MPTTAYEFVCGHMIDCWMDLITKMITVPSSTRCSSLPVSIGIEISMRKHDGESCLTLVFF